MWDPIAAPAVVLPVTLSTVLAPALTEEVRRPLQLVLGACWLDAAAQRVLLVPPQTTRGSAACQQKTPAWKHYPACLPVAHTCCRLARAPCRRYARQL